IAYAPSASVVFAIREQRGSSPTAWEGSILIIADPIFNPDDPRLKGMHVAESSSESRGLGLALETAANDVAGSGEVASAGRWRRAFAGWQHKCRRLCADR